MTLPMEFTCKLLKPCLVLRSARQEAKIKGPANNEHRQKHDEMDQQTQATIA